MKWTVITVLVLVTAWANHTDPPEDKQPLIGHQVEIKEAKAKVLTAENPVKTKITKEENDKKSIEKYKNEEEEEVNTASKSKERGVKKSIEVNGSIKKYILHYAAKYDEDGRFLLAVAKCESGLNPKAVNERYYAGGGHPSGLYQYLPNTWERYKNKLGKPDYNIWNPRHQAEVTAYAFSVGGSGEWACVNKLKQSYQSTTP